MYIYVYTVHVNRISTIYKQHQNVLQNTMISENSRIKPSGICCGRQPLSELEVEKKTETNDNMKSTNYIMLSHMHSY